MKQIQKGVTQVIALDQVLTTGKHVSVSLVGENGTTILTQTLTYNTDTKLYQASVTIPQDVTNQYLRFYFQATDATILPAYYPEDYELVDGLFTGIQAEIVPTSYFIDYILSANTKLDSLYKTAISKFVADNRPAFQKYLQTATYQLERECRLFFSERTITGEKKDFFYDKFSMHLWQFMVQNPPINSLVSFKLVYANSVIADIDPSLFVWDRKGGIIEFLPVPSGDSMGLYSLLMSNLSGLTLTILTNSTLERVPAMFRVDYKTGLIYSGTDPNEREAIRQAVARRALVNILPIIDPTVRQPSFSEGLDGVSTSRSYGTDRMMKDYREQEKQFIHDLRTEYGRNIDMVVV